MDSFRYQATARSLQVSKEDVMATALVSRNDAEAATPAAEASDGDNARRPRGVVYFSERLLRENVTWNDGTLTYRIRLARP